MRILLYLMDEIPIKLGNACIILSIGGKNSSVLRFVCEVLKRKIANILERGL